MSPFLALCLYNSLVLKSGLLVLLLYYLTDYILRLLSLLGLYLSLVSLYHSELVYKFCRFPYIRVLRFLRLSPHVGTLFLVGLNFSR